MNKFYKRFTSKGEMIASVVSLNPKFNVEKSTELSENAKVSRLYLSPTGGGKVIRCDSFKKFLAMVVSKTDLDLLYPLSYSKGEVYTVFSKTDYFSEVVSDDDEEENHFEEEEIVLSSEEEIADVLVPDWGWVDSLVDSEEKDVKLQLDQYAEKFGISLKRNKSLKNMIRDFKTEYEAK